MSQETIALTASPQQLIALIRALAGHANDEGSCTSLYIRAHDTNAGNVLEGDATLTSANYGLLLSSGDSRTWNNGKGCNDVSLLNKWFMSSGGAGSIDVEWEQT